MSKALLSIGRPPVKIKLSAAEQRALTTTIRWRGFCCVGRGDFQILNRAQIKLSSQAELGLYVHLPFCARRCGYCDFNAQGFDRQLAGPLWQAINLHLQKLPELYGPQLAGRALSSIYLGGGTPSLWPASQLNILLENIGQLFKLAADAEISLEANPCSLSPGKLRRLQAGGYNRLSLGAQSFNTDHLQILQRTHRPQQVNKSVVWARQAGFSNISLDIIYGLPSQSVKQAVDDVRQALAFKPEHLSLYQLNLNHDTPMGRLRRAGQLHMPDENTVINMESRAWALCETAGLEQYEVSNFARPGFSCRHNRSTWQGDDYLALGPGAHGHIAGRRWANHYDLPAYIAAWQPSGSGGVQFVEQLTLKQRASELFMLGLRTTQGVDLQRLSQLLGEAAAASYAQPINTLQQQGWAHINGHWLLPTRLGLQMADRAALEFI